MRSMKASLLTAPIVFETSSPLFFSFYSDGAFEKKWLPWKALHFELREDATLSYAKTKGAKGVVLDVSVTTLEKIPVDGSDGGVQLGVISDIGVRVTCKKEGIDSEFRCVFPVKELMNFVDALSSVGTIKNLRKFKAVMQWNNQPDWLPISSNLSHQNPLHGTFLDPAKEQTTLYGGNSSGGSGAGNEIELLHRTIGSGHGHSSVSGASGAQGSTSTSEESLAHILSFASDKDRDVAIRHFANESHNHNGCETPSSLGKRSGGGGGSSSSNLFGNLGRRVEVLQTIGKVGGESLCTHLGSMQSGSDGRQYIIQQSSMRRAVTAAMDQYDRENRKLQTIARRGAFKWLPVYFSNDLVHGSWWFVFGSMYTTVISLVILLNSYYPHSLLGEETGVVLPINMYRFTWMLLSFSGTLMTIGSLAFVRAVNEPPMKPLLGCWVHTGTDELLGSWLFFWGTMPAIPYSLCYLAILQNYWYLGMLFISIVSVLATYLFVLSCYPSNEGSTNGGRTSTLLKCCICVCGPKPFLKKHIANDWLAGCWFMYYSTVLGTVACLLLFIYEAVRKHSSDENYIVTLFVYGTSFTDYIGFLIGSLYFVAGSYPSETGPKLSRGNNDSGNGSDSDLDPLSP